MSSPSDSTPPSARTPDPPNTPEHELSLGNDTTYADLERRVARIESILHPGVWIKAMFLNFALTLRTQASHAFQGAVDRLSIFYDAFLLGLRPVNEPPPNFWEHVAFAIIGALLAPVGGKCMMEISVAVARASPIAEFALIATILYLACSLETARTIEGDVNSGPTQTNIVRQRNLGTYLLGASIYFVGLALSLCYCLGGAVLPGCVLSGIVLAATAQEAIDEIADRDKLGYVVMYGVFSCGLTLFGYLLNSNGVLTVVKRGMCKHLRLAQALLDDGEQKQHHD